MSERSDGLGQDRVTVETAVTALTPDEWRERWVEKGTRRDARVGRNLMRGLAAIALTIGAVWAALRLW